MTKIKLKTAYSDVGLKGVLKVLYKFQTKNKLHTFSGNYEPICIVTIKIVRPTTGAKDEEFVKCFNF